MLSNNKKIRREIILGISFVNCTLQDAVLEIQKGGYMVVPAAPALVTMPFDPRYTEAVIKSDMAIADSRYMTLLWLFLRGRVVKRISGLTFLKEFITLPAAKLPGALFLVNPTDSEAEANSRYLNSLGFSVDTDCSYTAPMYGEDVRDEKLAEILEKTKPKFILINIGGGQQEKLALYLKENLSYNPAIICTGAALAFLTGKQAAIPTWVDHVGLGWFMRCIENPRRFVPRYISALSLIKLMFRYGAAVPQSASIIRSK
jgi:UDP-N-acetyl-D-mannosaminuronic acid transferase (WecB/TagA/CpsF family)